MLSFIVASLICFTVPSFGDSGEGGYCKDIDFCGFIVASVEVVDAAPIDPENFDLPDSYFCYFKAEVQLVNKECKLADLVYCDTNFDTDEYGNILSDVHSFYTNFNGESFEFGGIMASYPYLAGADGENEWTPVGFSLSLWFTESNMIATSAEDVTFAARGITGFAKINDFEEPTQSTTVSWHESFLFDSKSCNGDSDDRNEDDNSIFNFAAVFNANNVDKNDANNKNVNHEIMIDISSQTIANIWILITVGFVLFIVGICLYKYMKSKN